MKATLEKIKASALEELSRADADLEGIRIKYLGKKGELTAVLRGMGALSAEERPIIGQLANDVRANIEEAISVKNVLFLGKLRMWQCWILLWHLLRD